MRRCARGGGGRLLALTLALPLGLAALPAAAQTASPPAAPAPTPEERSQALAKNEAGAARYAAGDLDAALDLFRAAHALDPTQATIQRNLALCLVARGDRARGARRFEQAALDYHEAGGLLPEDPQPPLREAAALLDALRDRDAAALLQALLARHPDLAPAQRLLGQALYRLGENARAIAHWERALALDPKDDRLRSLLERARRDESLEGDLLTDLGAAHFTIKYDGARDPALGREVGRVLEDAYQRVGQLLGRFPPQEVAVVVYPGRAFQAATGAQHWVAGLYDGKIRVPAQGLEQAPPAEVRRVLTHEYAHALLRAVGGPSVPTWLHEGFAQLAEGRTPADARRALAGQAVPTLKELSGSFVAQGEARARVLYAAAFDLVNALVAQGGTPTLADLLDRLGRGEALADAAQETYGQSLEELVAGWRRGLGAQ